MSARQNQTKKKKFKRVRKRLTSLRRSNTYDDRAAKANLPLRDMRIIRDHNGMGNLPRRGRKLYVYPTRVTADKFIDAWS